MNTVALKRILIVDDMATNRLLVKHLLTLSNYQVDEASSGTEALELLRQHPVDAVLLDVMMPEMDGFEVCEGLRQEPEFANLPIILVSALNSDEDKKHAEAVGATDYICKPFKNEDLQEKLEKAICG